jgi:hypothetical protein
VVVLGLSCCWCWMLASTTHSLREKYKYEPL